MTSTADAKIAANGWAINLAITPPANVRISSIAQATPLAMRCVSGNTTPAPSFVDQADGTIRDLNTGLLWSQCTEGQGAGCAFTPPTSMDWNAARGNCNGKVLAGRVWRLPNVNELLSIVDYSNAVLMLPAIDSTFFPLTANGLYWTSTTYDSNKSFAIGIFFSTGAVLANDKSGNMVTRCVTTF